MCTNLLDVTFDLPSLLLLICLYLTPVWPSTPEIVPFHSSFLIKPFLVSTFLPVFAANVAFLLKANGAFVRQLGILISMRWKVSGSKIIWSPPDLASDFYFMRRVQHLFFVEAASSNGRRRPFFVLKESRIVVSPVKEICPCVFQWRRKRCYFSAHDWPLPPLLL